MNDTENDIVIVSAARTPQGRLKGQLAAFTAPQLGSFAIRGALAQASVDPADIDAVIVGQVLADRRGMTIYIYICGDDSQDQLSCDHPEDTQAYRLAMCGGGDPVKCQQNWPYILADKHEKSLSRTWSVIQIDPKTGHRAAPGQADALSVWAYRDRPVYTYASDRRPGDVFGDGTGEWRGQRNGLKAFWLRDDNFNGAL